MLLSGIMEISFSGRIDMWTERSTYQYYSEWYI